MSTNTNGHQTTTRVAGKAHEAVDRVAKTAGNAEEYTREQASHADESLREAAAQGRQKAEDVLGRVNSYVSDNPMISIGIAFAAGALYWSLKRSR